MIEFKVVYSRYEGNHTLLELSNDHLPGVDHTRLCNAFVRLSNDSAALFPQGSEFILLPTGFGFKRETQIESAIRITEANL